MKRLGASGGFRTRVRGEKVRKYQSKGEEGILRICRQRAVVCHGQIADFELKKQISE